MAKKEVFSKDKVLLPLFALSLILIAILVGNAISTFIIVLLVILIVAFVYSIVKVKAFDKNLNIKIKESSYVLAFATFTTLIFIIILPYLLFHNSFLNIFVIQYVYFFPILFIFFSSLFLFNHIIKKEEIQYKHLAKSSLIIAIVLSVIISLILIAGSIFIFNVRTNLYDQGYDQAYDEAILELNEKQNLYSEGLPIFNEIKSYQDKFLEEANRMKEEFQNFYSNKGLCIKSNCAKIVADRAYHLIGVVINSAVIINMLEKANEELKYLESEQFKQDYISLEDYSFVLKNNIDESDFTITEISKERKEILLMFESDFTYDRYEGRIKKDNTKKTRINNIKDGYALILSPNSGSVFETDSLFYNSMSYVIEHSLPFKEMFRLIFKVTIYAEQQGRNNDLFVEIYDNKDIDESVESKTIRYKLILDKIEK